MRGGHGGAGAAYLDGTDGRGGERLQDGLGVNSVFHITRRERFSSSAASAPSPGGDRGGRGPTGASREGGSRGTPPTLRTAPTRQPPDRGPPPPVRAAQRPGPSLVPTPLSPVRLRRPRRAPGKGAGRFPPLPADGAGTGADENLQSGGPARGGREPERCGAACGGAEITAAASRTVTQRPPRRAARVPAPPSAVSAPRRHPSVACQPCQSALIYVSFCC
ncbi:uncharacterized protein [Excalfactoria chinensis]|uniref:uncharacterized protein n=1 Tax=Excalfactoria chinensis TaxID=46218 RepID=UPI003B3A8A26